MEKDGDEKGGKGSADDEGRDGSERGDITVEGKMLVGKGAGHAGKERQEGTAVMVDKALKQYTKRLIVRDEAKIVLKAKLRTFLGCLLGRPELSGSMDPKNVKKALEGWIGHREGVCDTIR